MLNLTTGFRIPLGFSRKRPCFSNPYRTHCWPQFFFKEAAEDGAAIMTPLGMHCVFPWVFLGFWSIFDGLSVAMLVLSLGKFHWASSQESWYHQPKWGVFASQENGGTTTYAEAIICSGVWISQGQTCPRSCFLMWSTIDGNWKSPELQVNVYDLPVEDGLVLIAATLW